MRACGGGFVSGNGGEELTVDSEEVVAMPLGVEAWFAWIGNGCRFFLSPRVTRTLRLIPGWLLSDDS